MRTETLFPYSTSFRSWRRGNRDPANDGDAPQHVNFVSASPGLRGRQPLLVEGDAEARRLAQLQPAVPLVDGLGQQVATATQAPLRRAAGEIVEGRLADARWQVCVGEHAEAVGPGVLIEGDDELPPP